MYEHLHQVSPGNAVLRLIWSFLTPGMVVAVAVLELALAREGACTDVGRQVAQR